MKEEFIKVVRRIEGYGCRHRHDPEEDRSRSYPSGGNMKCGVSQPVLVVHFLGGADKGIGRSVAKTHRIDALVDAPCLFAATVFEKLLICPAVGVLRILIAIIY